MGHQMATFSINSAPSSRALLTRRDTGHASINSAGTGLIILATFFKSPSGDSHAAQSSHLRITGILS